MRYVPPELLEHWRGRDPIDLETARLADCSRSTSRALRGRRGRRGRPRHRGGPWPCRCPSRGPQPTACSATARPSRSATGRRHGAGSLRREGGLMSEPHLPPGHLRRAARGDARRRARALPAARTSRLSVALQGHRGAFPSRNLGERARDGHHPLAESGDRSVRRSAPPWWGCGRCARCSSPTSMPAGSTSSSTWPARCTTARARRARSPCGCPVGGGFSGGPFQLPEPGGVVHARAGDQGGGGRRQPRTRRGS